MSVLDLLPLKKKKTPAKAAGYRPPATPKIEIPRFTPPIFPSQHPVPVRLAKKLAGLGQRLRFIRVSERVAQVVAVAVMLISAQMFLDWLIDLPFVIRFLFLAGDLTLAYWFIRKQILPFIVRPPNQEACALLVEKHWPKFRGKIIAAVQFAHPRTSADPSALVQVLQQQADAGTGALDFGEIVPTRPLVRRLGMAVTLVLLFGCVMVFWAPGTVALLERVFLIPAKVPRHTEVVCLTKDQTIPAGDDLTVEAQTLGVRASHGRITLEYASGRIQEITIDPEKDRSDFFSIKIAKVEEPFTYIIRINDGISDKYHVSTVPRPNVTTIECTQTYPAYTGLDPIKRTVGNLALLAGSTLKIHATTNSLITKAVLKEIGVDKTIPLTIGGKDNKELTGQIDIPTADLTGYSIQLTNQAGVTSGDETQYRIDLIPDRPPVVQITEPDRLEELDTLKAKPPIVFTATDDYGLAKVSLLYRIAQDDADTAVDANGAPAAPPDAKRIDIPLGQGHPQNLQRTYLFDLGGLQPPVHEGTSLEYWIEAQDGNNVTGPGIGESEHHLIKIVTAMEKKAEIMDRMLNQLSAVEETNTAEKDLNKQLQQALQNGPDQTKPDPTKTTPPAPPAK